MASVGAGLPRLPLGKSIQVLPVSRQMLTQAPQGGDRGHETKSRCGDSQGFSARRLKPVRLIMMIYRNPHRWHMAKNTKIFDLIDVDQLHWSHHLAIALEICEMTK